ncbi:MAG: histidinol-phosphate transaminase [Zetaproteobacteria bacterium]|nr:MAG: histidinol-phosphate transaminase [Zetaproteobacteria bacterium]
MSVEPDWLKRAVDQAAALHPYVPGKPLEQLLRERGIAEAVKLASNENPFGPSPAACEAMARALGEVHRYPDGNATELKTALAVRHGVSADHILPGNGSNEVLELVIRTFAGPGDRVVSSKRGFIVYALAAQAAGAQSHTVPEPDGLTHDLDAMAEAVDERTKVVCIANPNNPTGTVHDAATVQRFLDALPRDVVVILDEAYHEFVSDLLGDSWQRLSHPGLVITRTFSKAYGLAGCRIGYAVSSPGLLEIVNRFREPFNVNVLAQQAALAALNDEEWMIKGVEAVKQQRTRLESFLDELGMLGGRSHGNFVLLRHPKAAEIAQELEALGMIPRPLGPYGMADYLRITVGRPEENDRLMDALASIAQNLEIHQV